MKAGRALLRLIAVIAAASALSCARQARTRAADPVPPPAHPELADAVAAEPAAPSPSHLRISKLGVSKSRRLGATVSYGYGESLAPGFNTEGYDHISENRFLDVIGNPLSTFSIDVDTAAYANVRRFLTNNRLPVKDSVRIEELVNYFTYDYPEPVPGRPFSVNTEISACPWNSGNRLLHIGLQAEKVALGDLPPNNLVFLVDVSGSMNDPRKLPLLVNAFKLLVEGMREQDRVAIVVYAGAAGQVLPSTSGADKAQILAALDKLQSGGSTAGAAGIRLAYNVATQNLDPDGNNRVILATDGDFNVGVSSDSELVRLIEEKRDKGIFLTVLGFGTGNYKDSKMEKLADKGNGNYAYIDSLQEARKVLVNEMGSTLLTIAKDVKLQIEFNPAKVKAYRLVGYENRMLRKEDFDDDRKDAGELGAGHTVTALYELVPQNGFVSDDDSRYQVTRPKRGIEYNGEIAFLKLRHKAPAADESELTTYPIRDSEAALHNTSDNFRFSAAVAEWGMLLRDSGHKAGASYEQVLELAQGALGPDSYGYRAEFIDLVKRSSQLTPAIAEVAGE